jgi:hypothetical protein
MDNWQRSQHWQLTQPITAASAASSLAAGAR